MKILSKLIVLNLTYLYFSFFSICYAQSVTSPIKRVAHAGGAIDGYSNTNSLEALSFNYNQGFEFFEIDFSFTKDGYLVCIHDWHSSFETLFKFKATEKPSLEIFKYLVKYASSYQACTIDDLNLWLKKHPKAKIITDIKQQNLKALKIISQKIDNFQNIIIPQLYFPNNYLKIKNMGYKSIIWSLYKYKGTNTDIIKEAHKMQDLLAITMPPYRARSGLPYTLLKNNIPSYVHTLNSKEHLNEYINKYGVTEIYTDFLPPTNNTINLNPKNKQDHFNVKDDCIAQYSQVDGSLFVPCISMPDSPNPGLVYELQMQQQMPNLIFKLNSYGLKPNNK